MGLLHGAAELLPISSSGHMEAIPWLLGWDRGQLEPGLRKSFDVALHAGATAGWLLSPQGGGREALADLRRAARDRRLFLALAVGLPGAAGVALQEPIERRLGTTRTVTAGLLAGSLAMLAADRRGEGVGGVNSRGLETASPKDGLWLGLAQASALVPGVSRSGASLTMARLRGFDRADSRRLAAQVGLPVIAGAAVLKLARLLQQPLDGRERLTLTVGAGASFASAWLVAPLAGRAGGSLTPYAMYRLVLVLAILARQRPGG